MSVSRGKRTGWQPGDGRQPSLDEARGYDDWVREDPGKRWPVHSREVYAQLGFRSGDPNVEGQMSLDSLPEADPAWQHEDVKGPEFERLQQWSDIPDRKVSAAESRQTGVPKFTGKPRPEIESEEAEKTGTNIDDMTRRAGFLLDESQRRAGVQGVGQGRDFYASTEPKRIGAAATRQRVSYATMASATGVMSPQTAWYERGRYPNLEGAERTVEAALQGEEGLPEIETGLPEMQAHAKTIAENPGTRSTDLLKGGPKVRSFEQNLLTPHEEEGRATVDVHMVQGITDIEDKKEQQKFLGRTGRYEMSAEAIKRASQQRGLYPEEGQSLGWHEQKKRNITGASGRASGSMGKGRAQSTDIDPSQAELLGQRTIMGGEVVAEDPRAEAMARARVRDDIERTYTPRSKYRSRTEQD